MIINNKTCDLNYSNINNPINDSCPITHEDFNDDSIVCQISHCHHNFNKNALVNWLKQNYTCPICRYNILTNSNMIKYTLNNDTSLILTRRQFSTYLTQHIFGTIWNMHNVNE